MWAEAPRVDLIGLSVGTLDADVAIPEGSLRANTLGNGRIPNSTVIAGLERNTTASAEIGTIGTACSCWHALGILPHQTDRAQPRNWGASSSVAKGPVGAAS